MWCVLVAVGEQNIATPSAIADYIGIIRPAASRTLRQMEKSGLLHRSAGTDDKRTTRVALTHAGKTALDASLPLALATRADLEAALSAREQAQLTTLLEKLTTALQATATGV